MSTIPSALTSQSDVTGTQTTATSTSSVDQLANKTTFLQLLVAQIKNQDPLQPMDGTAFVSQLAQFSELEQLLGIRGDLDSMKSSATQTRTIDPAAQSQTQTQSASQPAGNTTQSGTPAQLN